MILAVLKEAVAQGAGRAKACAVLGVSVRTVVRWTTGPADDGRHGPTTGPANKLSPAERAAVLAVATAPAFRDLSPKQMVPRLADTGVYLASESTFYRLLAEADLLAPRGRAKAPQSRPPNTHVATGPAQVWSWDITYLPTPVRGVFLYLYLMLDVWSRKIVGWEVHLTESADLAAGLFGTTCRQLGLDPRGLVLQADNGGPMKGATMVATLEQLGVLPSFSRPSVSDDNPFSEALFRTMKYRPEYPDAPFPDREAARTWVASFVRWYNTVHLHSGIQFVTPEDRHAGRDVAILAGRQAVYARAKQAQPTRWSGPTRSWVPVSEVRLNPPKVAAVPPPFDQAA